MTPLDRLTAVVVNWNTPELTVRAVRALAEDGLPPDRAVVVDNGSGDGSVERLAAELPEATVVALPENVGFARASNEGARRLRGEAYLLVNSDAFVRRAGSVTALSAALDDPGVGVVLARLLNEDGSVQHNVAPLPSPLVALVQATGLSRFVPDRWQPSVSTHWRHDTAREVQAGIGAVMLARGTTWDALGGFDPESAFMYAEDRDLCWRARQAGWRVWFTPEAEFTHLGGGSTEGRWGSPARAERVGAAEAALIRRHRGRVGGAVTLAVVCGGLFVRTAAARALGRRDAAAVFRAGLRGFSQR
jgi:N-acetylglucosaminyl-diphospho-decaprenol L-rhamnosyltransferase